MVMYLLANAGDLGSIPGSMREDKCVSISHFHRVLLLGKPCCNLPGSSVHGILQAKYTGTGHHALIQGIFPTQGSNSRLLHWQVGSLPLKLPGKPEKTNNSL